MQIGGPTGGYNNSPKIVIRKIEGEYTPRKNVVVKSPAPKEPADSTQNNGPKPVKVNRDRKYL